MEPEELDIRIDFEIARRRAERRQRIATAVLSGFAAGPEPLNGPETATAEESAEHAVRWADALIAELDK